MIDYEQIHREYLQRITARTAELQWQGVKEGLKTNWRWRLYFWLLEKLGNSS